MSHDFEDIIFILNSCPYVLERYNNESDTKLKKYLSTEMSKFIKRPNIQEEIECMLPIGDEDRLEYVWEVMQGLV